jgi:soluble lytic murein transglycosylase-like protein
MRRRPLRLILACMATALGPAVVAQADDRGVAADGRPDAAGPATAVVEFPLPGNVASWRGPARSAAATCPGLPSEVLVAIAHVESRLGQRPGPSSAGARGPMQFLPATWAVYGTDGDGDGRADVMNAVDALHGAARFLCAHGGGEPSRLPSAVWSYNHSDRYVREVLGLAWLDRSVAP